MVHPAGSSTDHPAGRPTDHSTGSSTEHPPVRSTEHPAGEASLSAPLIALFKGGLYRDDQPAVWQSLLRLEARAREYVAVLGLELILDEAEGHAFLRQNRLAEGEEELPRLVPRRQLSYSVSLLLALLRKKLVEHDASGGDPRLILTKDQVIEAVRIFLPETADEVRLQNRIEADLNKVAEMGFVRRLKGQQDRFEVRRILASFVDAQWLAELDQRLAEYREHGEQVY